MRSNIAYPPTYTRSISANAPTIGYPPPCANAAHPTPNIRRAALHAKPAGQPRFLLPIRLFPGGSPRFHLIRFIAFPGKAMNHLPLVGEGFRGFPLHSSALKADSSASRLSEGTPASSEKGIYEPSPEKGKVAETIFTENRFRRMRSNFGYAPRYAPPPFHSKPPGARLRPAVVSVFRSDFPIPFRSPGGLPARGAA